MAHDIFDYNDGWDQNLQDDEDEVIDLEEEARKQQQELLAQQWRDGELFVTTDYVLMYENPTDPSPVICEIEPDTVILLSSLKESSNYGGFRDVLLPVRGWIWTSVDEYDRAFYDASRALKNIQTRDTSTSMQRIQKYMKRKIKKVNSRSKRIGSETDNNSTEFDDVKPRQHAFSDAELIKDHHQRGKTNHLYVSEKQREIIKKQQLAISMSFTPIGDSVDRAQYTPEPPSTHSFDHREYSMSNEHSSKYRRMSHQVRYSPAAIKNIEKPLSLEELEAKKDEIDAAHFQMDSDGVIVGNIQRGNTEKKVIETEIPEEKEQESLLSKIVHSRTVLRLIHFVRSHPWLLTLIYIGFTGFVEGIIFFDIITDIIVVGGLHRSVSMQPFFVISVVLIITPYFIAWSSVWGLIDKKREIIGKSSTNHIIFGSSRRYRIFVTLFSFAPFGVLLLILFDIWIVFEFIIIRPIYFLFRFKLFRSDTFEELGYRKLRRVSEVCAETLFQALIQLSLILVLRHNALYKQNDDIKVSVFDVTLSLFASFFVITLWFGIILRIESSSNGISLIEYLPIVLQGSFKFVPFLPAIEKGTKNGESVNWCLFKFDLNALTALGRALGAPNCHLQTIKVSRKTFKKLPRFGCKLFGRLMNTALSEPIDVIISRLDSDMEQLFQLFDIQNTKYFNFIDFCRATLALRAQDNERVKYVEISSIFYELSGNKKYELENDDNGNDNDNDNDKESKVWLLDLMLKFRTSKQYVSVLDIEQPEDYSVKQNDVNLITFVRSMGFHSVNHEMNVISAVCSNKLDVAHVLTEDDGIPIVVEITEGFELLASYMNFHRVNTDNDNNNDNHNDNNMVRVQKYHELNLLRRKELELNHCDDPFDHIFGDVSIYVSVSFCEQEKTTESTKETINQFWNEKLLFIIPYSVIDDIKNDATHTLQRDTEHNEHFSDLYQLTTRRHSFVPIKLPDYASNSITNRDKYINIEKKEKTKSVVFSGIKEEEQYEEEESVDVPKYHHNTATVHIKNQNTMPSINDDDQDIDDDVPRYQTGLTERIDNLFHIKSKPTISIEKVPSDSPNVLNNVKILSMEHKPSSSSHHHHAKKQQSSINPLLFGNTGLLNHRRGTESFVRHSLHLSNLARQSSFGQGMTIPHFEKKLYLDFNLFDDSAINNNQHQSKDSLNEAYWDFQPQTSTGSITSIHSATKRKRNRRKHDHDNSGSDDDQKEKLMGLNTPTTHDQDNKKESKGIDGGEGTFLGSAHISINIDDPKALATFHNEIKQKEIKIGRTQKNKNIKYKESKLKFKVYCNALSAYLIHGKNYGDKIREKELRNDVDIVINDDDDDNKNNNE